jgi:hypothetical protein
VSQELSRVEQVRKVSEKIYGRTAGPGVVSSKARIKELEAENASLRKRLNMDQPTNLTEWEGFGTPRIRAEMAARALYEQNCSAFRAMKVLGFDEKDARNKTIQDRILKSDAVMEILEASFQPPKELKKAILERSAEKAILANDDVSTRATAQLAKLAGWIKPEPPANVTVSLVSLMNPAAQQEKKVEAITSDDIHSILGHQPGEPVRINTGDKAVERALVQNEDA